MKKEDEIRLRLIQYRVSTRGSYPLVPRECQELGMASTLTSGVGKLMSFQIVAFNNENQHTINL